jgi:hypothetical protein
MIERLPGNSLTPPDSTNRIKSSFTAMMRVTGATDENIELSINNLAVVERKGLRSYLDQPVQVADPSSSSSDQAYTGRSTNFRSFEPALDKILDDCIVG